MDPVIGKCSPGESKDWKVQRFPSCYVLSSLSASLIHPKHLLSKSSWVTVDEQDSIIFKLISPFNIHLCFCVCSQSIPKICPWDLKPDLVSGYQQVYSKGATQPSLANLICYLLQSVSVGLLSLCLRKSLNRRALHLPTTFFMWSFTTMTTIKTILFKSVWLWVVI